jgi:anti-anti-sigma factor
VAVQEAEGKTLVTSYGGIWWTSGSRPVAHLWGELDAANAAGVFAIIRQGVERREVVIDLSDVVFMGSNVLGELLTLTKDAAVRVVAPQGGQPRRVLELTGLTATISTFDTVAAALDAH